MAARWFATFHGVLCPLCPQTAGPSPDGIDRGWSAYSRLVEFGTFAGFGLLLCAGFACLFLIAVVGLLAAWWKPKG